MQSLGVSLDLEPSAVLTPLNSTASALLVWGRYKSEHKETTRDSKGSKLALHQLTLVQSLALRGVISEQSQK